MKSVLVTGATGFVGSHALEALDRQEELRVIAACRDPGRLPAGFRGEVRAGDLRDARYRSAVVAGVDTVCHAAAWTSLYGHKEASRELYFEPTAAFVDAALAAGVGRFVNVSTTSAAAPTRSSDPMSEGIPRSYWPHLCNVVAIEDLLRKRAGPEFTAVNLRLGIFAGTRYALGLLPILLPRLKTHLVPWVAGGKTSLPIIDGRDIGGSFVRAVLAEGLSGYESFNIVGPTVPTVREVIEFIHTEFGYPKPHFSVPFPVAFGFAWLMELIDPLVPWEPLVTRSIIHLVREVDADNRRARELLGYEPTHDWREAVRTEIEEMAVRQSRPMSMARPVG